MIPYRRLLYKSVRKGTTEHEEFQVAGLTSFVVKFGAFVFILGVPVLLLSSPCIDML
jgi:hypothetical protein